MKLSCLLLLIFSLHLFSSSLVFAENVANKTKELTVLQKKIKQITDKINGLKVKKNSLIDDLKSLDVQYGKSAEILKNLTVQVDRVNIFLEQNQQKIWLKQKDINKQKKSLSSLVKAAHGMGRNEKLKLLLNQQDPSLSGRMMVYYDFFNKTRMEKISAINKNLQQLRVLEAEQLEESGVLKSKLNDRKLERSLLLETQLQQKAVLAEINKQFYSENKQLNRYKVSEKRLKDLIRALQQAMDDFPLEEGVVKEFAKLKGYLPWPVKGRILKKFGSQRAESRWDGVLIRAKEGLDIKSVTRGRVVYADWLRGYGLLTIIDHGKGYMSLYAFNQSLYKTVGEWVEAGSVIASVGQSGGQLETGLYFGIRQKGMPVNPVKWCRKIRHGTAM